MALELRATTAFERHLRRTLKQGKGVDISVTGSALYEGIGLAIGTAT